MFTWCGPRQPPRIHHQLLEVGQAARARPIGAGIWATGPPDPGVHLVRARGGRSGSTASQRLQLLQ